MKIPASHGTTASVAFLGLGAMGQRMAQRLLDAETALTTWSRSGASLRAPQARRALTLPEAVEGAEIVLSMVRDDVASRDVWLGENGALRHLQPGAIVVECSTLSPAWVTELHAETQRVGARFMEAPVVGSRPQAEGGQLIFLAGGAEETVEEVRPLLLRMGSAIHHVGSPPAGAYSKLIVNTLFAAQVASLAELLGFAEKAKLNLPALLATLEGLPVLSASAKGAAAGMLSGRFDPMFPVELVGKDLRYSLASAGELAARLPMADAARRVFQEGAERGLQAENLTAVAKLYFTPCKP